MIQARKAPKKTGNKQGRKRKNNNPKTQLEKVQLQQLFKKVRPRNRLSFTDAETAAGFETLLQTLFSGISGIHRGIALGAQTTALCRFRQVLDVTIPAGTYLTYAWTPVAITVQNCFAYSAGAGATQPYDPFNSSGVALVTANILSGPFFTINPSTEYRIVRASMRWTPTNPVTTQGGPQLHCYVPNTFGGVPLAGNLAGLQSNVTAGPTAWATTNLENFEFFKTFEGTEQTYMQWFPNDNEIEIENLTTWNSTSTAVSGFFGTVFAPVSNAQTYRIEFDYGIEYVPNVAYRPYVDRDIPVIHPNAFYELNKYISKHWDEAVVTTVKQHDLLTSTIEHIRAPFTARYQLSNQVSGPSNALPGLQTATLFDRACGGIMDATGMDLCGVLGDAANGMVRTAGQELLQTYVSGTQPMMLML